MARIILDADPVKHQELVSSFIKAIQMLYQLYYNIGDGWIVSNLFNNHLGTAIREAEACSKNDYRMTEVRDIQNAISIVKFPAGGGEPYYINPDFKNQIVDAFNGQLICRVEFPEPIHVKSDETLSLSITFKICPDCKDGFYYPFAGPKEPCRTCK